LALLLVVLITVGLLAGCSSAAPTPTTPSAPTAPATPPAQPIKLQLAHVQALTHAYTPLFKNMCDDIRKESNGLLDIIDFPASQLGSEEEQCIAVTNGTLDITSGAPDTLGKQFTPLIAMHSPYIFKDLDHARRFIASDMFAGWIEDAAKSTNARILNTMFYGTRELTSSKKIVTPDDLKGFKLRIPMAPAQMAFAEATGAVATPMAIAEVYLALQQKTVDGQENPVPTIIAQKFYEVQPYLMRTGHIKAFNITFINEGKWNTLSADLQKILKDNMEKVGEKSFTDIIAATDAGIKDLQAKGVEVVEIDQDAFNALGQKCIESLAKQFGDELLGVYDEIQKI
jgi:tripartite ATP-independent transporter DctP family solute receptor